MSKMWTVGLLAFSLGLGPASAAPAIDPDVIAQQLIANAKVKAWFERTIEHMLDETAHVARMGTMQG